MAWLVPSREFAALVPSPNGRGRRVFKASMKSDTSDRWWRWRLEPAKLATQVLARLAELDANATGAVNTSILGCGLGRISRALVDSVSARVTSCDIWAGQRPIVR
jgi:hypothetical protein